ncbi:YceI family protein [Psychroserpens sp. BH13MA-6]
MKTPIVLLALTFFMLTNAISQEQLPIDTEKSRLKWSADYTFYFGGHYGLVDFKEGYFLKENDVIVGGVFVIDMNTITSTDIKDKEPNESLVNHLKDPDFFDVSNHPLAQLVIKSVDYHDATHMKVFADLTIVGKTLPIDFQAEVDYEKKQMTTKFKIDRMRWGINYNSKLRDGAISDAIAFEVKLVL